MTECRRPVVVDAVDLQHARIATLVGSLAVSIFNREPDAITHIKRMEKYRLVGERKSEVTESGEEEGASEVRITQQGKPRNYISYALGLFEQGSAQIELKAMGRAINKAVTIAEILKRKMPLHQITSLSSSEIIDVFEPLEEGLDVVESKRYVSCMAITLSKDGSGMDVNDIGYQPPLSSEEIQPGDLNVARRAQAQSGHGGPPAAAPPIVST